METLLKDGINWVGYVDEDVRDFHGYQTLRGSSYNSYLIEDDKIALIDTVKEAYVDKLLKNISTLVDPSRIDYVICNHAEPDHSGGLPVVMEACINAELVCNEKCRDILSGYYDITAWNFKIVKDLDVISLGKRTLTFIETPMVHWPESMFTYVAEEKLLFSMDAFGQHYATSSRFDDEEDLSIIMEEARTYYANIVMLYGKPIKKVLERAEGIDIEMIAPSHGVIWRGSIDKIISAYNDWVLCKSNRKVVILYDTMWRSTEMMANAIEEGVRTTEAEVRVIDLRSDHLTRVATEALSAAVIAVGSPTLNKTMMPGVAAALTYLKGLAPTGKKGFIFGSYGWAKGASRDIEEYMQKMKFEILSEPVLCQFKPDEKMLDECRAAGKVLGEAALTV